MNCPKCGFPNPDINRVCQNCGTPLQPMQQPSAPVAPQQPVAPQAPVAPQQPVMQQRPVAPQQPPMPQGAPAPAPAPAKKKTGLLIGIICGAVAVVVIVAIIVICLISGKSGNASLTFQNGETISIGSSIGDIRNSGMQIETGSTPFDSICSQNDPVRVIAESGEVEVAVMSVPDPGEIGPAEDADIDLIYIKYDPDDADRALYRLAKEIPFGDSYYTFLYNLGKAGYKPAQLDLSLFIDPDETAIRSALTNIKENTYIAADEDYGMIIFKDSKGTIYMLMCDGYECEIVITDQDHVSAIFKLN